MRHLKKIKKGIKRDKEKARMRIKKGGGLDPFGLSLKEILNWQSILLLPKPFELLCFVRNQ